MSLYLKYLNVSKLPSNHFQNPDNVKNFMAYVAISEGYKEIEDWYKCTRTIVEKYSNVIFSYKKCNIIDLLNICYDNQYQFIPWKFNPVPGDFWNDFNNHKWYMDWLFKELNYKTIEDWYNISRDIINKKHGGGLLPNKYNHSPILMVKTIYPDYEWIEWKFKNTCKNFWKEKENKRKYMDWLFKELNYKNMEDWYNINYYIIRDNYGARILSYYENSPRLLLEDIYPEYEWIPWKFFMISINYWDSIENQRKYMDWLFKQLEYKNMEDWYKVNRGDFKNHCGYGLLTLKKYNTNISKLLTTIYYDYDWDINKFNNYSGEAILNEFLTSKYKNVIWNYRSDWCKNPETNKTLPFDFYLPDNKIMIELDGSQHFEKVSNWGNSEDIRKSDIYKMRMANENGYSVIRLFWEDVFLNKNNWKSKLKEAIKIYDIPKNIYLNEIYDKYY